MAAELKQELGADSELVKLGGGIFEVYRDDQLIFSKKQLGRFPTPGEVLNRMRSAADSGKSS